MMEHALEFLIITSELLNLTHYQVQRIFLVLNRGTRLLAFQRVVNFNGVRHLLHHWWNHRQWLDLHTASKNVLVTS